MNWKWYDPKLRLDEDLQDAEERLADAMGKSIAMTHVVQLVDRWLGLRWQQAMNSKQAEQAEGINRAKTGLQELMQRAYPDNK
jgi:hypothetical protein